MSTACRSASGDAKQANDGLLLQLAAQIERAIGGKWNAGQKPGVHVTKSERRTSCGVHRLQQTGNTMPVSLTG
jgi:hypothetical protein